MKFGSLFSGIGGFDLGFERAGMECAWQVEIDKDCQRTLAKQFPLVLRLEDVTTIGRLPDVDVLCGGFPCQDLSVAGKRAGLDGERSGLWFEFLRIIKSNRPRWVVIENVPGLLSSENGRDFAVILRGLVKCGYGVSWRILDAQYFGLAQRRKRLFIVGSLGNGSSAQILFESEGGGRHPAESREARAGVAPILEIGARTNGDGDRDGDGIGADGDPMYTLQSGKQHGVAYQCHGSNVGEMGTLRAGNGNESGGVPFVAATLKGRGRGACDEVEIRTSDISPQLSCGGGKPGSGYPAVAFTERTRTEGRTFESQEELAYALTNPGSGGRSHSRSIAGEFGVRRLTPRECERLQGFPDDWTLFDAEGKVISDSARYRMLGNAVAVPVAEWIGKRIVSQ